MAIINTKENYLFMLGHLATDICHGSLPIILAYMYQQGRIDSYSQLASMMMANTILNALVQPLAGGLADGKARPYLMSLGIFLALTGVMYLGIVQDHLLIYGLICLNGIGSSLFHPLGGKLTNVFGGKKLGKSLSIFSLGGNAGMALGPFYFTALYMLFGLKATLAMGIPGIIMIAIFLSKNRFYTLACLKNKIKIKRTPDAQAQENIKGFLILVGVLFLRSSGWFTFTAFLSLYFMHYLGVKDEIATFLNGMVCLFGAIATFTGGTFSDKFGYNRLVILASCLSIPFISLFTLTTNPYLATLLLIPFAFFHFAAMSPTVVIGQKLLCKHVGMATGFTIGLSMTFGGLVSPLMGKLGDIYGIHSVMYAVAIVISLAAIGNFFIPKVK